MIECVRLEHSLGVVCLSVSVMKLTFIRIQNICLNDWGDRKARCNGDFLARDLKEHVRHQMHCISFNDFEDILMPVQAKFFERQHIDRRVKKLQAKVSGCNGQASEEDLRALKQVQEDLQVKVIPCQDWLCFFKSSPLCSTMGCLIPWLR